ncbi:MAG: hypothetical protein GY914_01480 [Prochlorococcus sp.]|nr:hypothetical protein [Prochlorococcus sp.]
MLQRTHSTLLQLSSPSSSSLIATISPSNTVVLVNRTNPDGIYTRRKLGIHHVLHNSVSMQQGTTTFNNNTNNNNLTPLLNERLDLWDQQDAAQRDGEFHKALLLERRIRQLNKEIRMVMGLEEGVPVEQGL